MKNILFIIVLFLKGLESFSQSNLESPLGESNISLKAQYYGDSVILRWSPKEPLVWKSGNQTGYRLVRYEVDIVNFKIIDSLVLSANLKVLSELQWNALSPLDTLARGFAHLLKDDKPIINGSFGEAYERKNMNDYRFYFSMFYTAVYPNYGQKMALRYTDITIKKNKFYRYVLRQAVKAKGLPAVTTVSTLVNTNKPDEPPKVPTVFKEEGDRKVTFRWNRALAEQQFIAYYYERSEDDGKTFIRLNMNSPYLYGNRDSLQILLVDSLPKNYKKYHYRILGLTTFGDVSKPSPSIIVIGKDLTAPTSASNLKAINLQGSEVKLTWQKPVIEGDFAGYWVGKSANLSGPFLPLNDKLLSKNELDYLDRTANSNGTNYYVVSAVDTVGNAAISIPAYVIMKDEAAPAIPTGLKGSIDSTGIIKITWNKNTEPDLLGYMVYTANQSDHVFTPLTTGFLADEFFADSTTLRTLTKNKYFKVVAFDKSRHASPYSEILTIKRPDKVAPVAPVFNNFSISDSSAGISWIPSSSDDVAKQVLFRKEDGNTEFQEIKTFNSTTKEFNDSNLKPGVWYSYAIQAVDESGLKSEKSFPLRVKPYRTGIKPKVKQFSASLGSDKKSINISWTYALNENQRVLIYRKINDGELQLIEGVNHPENKFQDKVKEKGQYNYATKIKYADGSESVLTEFIKILIQ
jgi:uncharacterized protein